MIVRFKELFILIALILLVTLLAWFVRPDPPAPLPFPATDTVTPLPTPTHTLTPVPTPTLLPKPTFTPSPTLAPTSTPTRTPAPSPTPTASPMPFPTLVIHLVEPGDTLWDISECYYGWGWLYGRIVETNGQIYDPWLIFPGWALVIPEASP